MAIWHEEAFKGGNGEHMDAVEMQSKKSFSLREDCHGELQQRAGHLNAVEIAEHQSAHLHVNVLLSNSQKVARESKKSS